MLFKDHHIDQIRSGSKTVTRRDWASGYTGPNVGTVVRATTELFESTEECDCFIEIVAKDREQLGEITTNQAQKEGDYETVEEFKEAWIDINGSWNPEMVVDVVEFEYVGREHPDEQASEAVVS